MAKKTRKEKMAAQLRRLRQESTQNENFAQKPNETAPSTVNFRDFQPSKPAITPRTAVASLRYDYLHVYGDLRKIALLIVVTIAFEVALNLTMRSSFAKLILRTFGIEI